MRYKRRLLIKTYNLKNKLSFPTQTYFTQQYVKNHYHSFYPTGHITQLGLVALSCHGSIRVRLRYCDSRHRIDGTLRLEQKLCQKNLLTIDGLYTKRA